MQLLKTLGFRNDERRMMRRNGSGVVLAHISRKSQWYGQLGRRLDCS